jgi:hypothetical protein
MRGPWDDRKLGVWDALVGRLDLLGAGSLPSSAAVFSIRTWK